MLLGIVDIGSNAIKYKIFNTKDNCLVEYYREPLRLGKNLDNRPEFYYWNSPDRLSQYDEYGYWMSFGFRYNF